MRKDELTVEEIKHIAEAMDKADKHYKEKLERAESVKPEALKLWLKSKVQHET